MANWANFDNMKDKNWWKMPKVKNSNATFWAIFKHCAVIFFFVVFNFSNLLNNIKLSFFTSHMKLSFPIKDYFENVDCRRTKIASKSNLDKSRAVLT